MTRKRLFPSGTSRKAFISSLLVLVMFAHIACGGKSQEDLIQEIIQRLGDYAEDRDVSSIMLYIADDYTDFRGRDKTATLEMLKSYISSYRGIVVHMLGLKISLDDALQASFQIDIMVSSGEVKIFRKMIKFAGDLFRIKGKMVEEEGMWKIMYAEWDYIPLEDLFPESLSILKKIFPNLPSTHHP